MFSKIENIEKRSRLGKKTETELSANVNKVENVNNEFKIKVLKVKMRKINPNKEDSLLNDNQTQPQRPSVSPSLKCDSKCLKSAKNFCITFLRFLSYFSKVFLTYFL